MHTTRRRSILGVVLGAVLLFSAAACGDDDAATDDGDSPPRGAPAEASSSSTYPVTVEHLGGTTTIEERPERIVTLNVQWTDALLAMGEQPLAYVLDGSRGETEPYPWQQGKLDGSERIDTAGTIPIEKIAALDPDLILVTFMVTDESQLATLQEIAPTIGPLGDLVDPWQDHIEVLGDVLGDPERADAVIAEVEGEVAGVADELPGLAGTTYAFANYVQGDGIYVVADPDDGASQVFSALGMEISPSILELDGARVGRVQISTEQIDLLDADFIGILTNGSDVSALPGWDRLPAVASGAAVEFEYVDVVGLNTPSALSVPHVLELMRPALEAVAG